MNVIKTSRPRPYWHVDMKWIGGLSFFGLVAATLLLFNLSVLTERENATTTTATFVASMFSKDGLDDEAGVAEFRQKAALLPGDTVAPIEQFPWLKIAKDDIATKSPSELRILIFRQLTDPIYDKGLAGAAVQLTSNVAEQESFKKDAFILGLVTKETHDTLQQAFIIAAIIAVLVLGELVYFSAGWGRLVSPGLVSLLASAPGAVAGLLLLNPPTNGDSPISSLPSSLVDTIGHSLSQSYGLVAICGAGLLVAALIGKIVSKILRRKKSVSQKPSVQ